MDGTRTIWTVGTGHRSLEELVAILADAGVERVADVRSYPKSHLGHFDRDRLAAGLAAAGIDFLWLGSDLGGLRRGGYEAHMETGRFTRGLAQLERAAGERSTAVLCAEIDPERCHRRLIAAALVEHGWEIVHLLGGGASRRPGPRQSVLPFAG